jgi:uncharacterized protein YecT (DUF1311 family)
LKAFIAEIPTSVVLFEQREVTVGGPASRAQLARSDTSALGVLSENDMAALGSGLIVVGVLTALVGVGGFVDTRKVDRRYRTGYKNNEPDSRNIGRARKVLLYGIGICIIGAAINSILDPENGSSPAAVVQNESVAIPEAVQPVASDTSPSKAVAVKLDPSDAQSPQQSSEVPSNESVVKSNATPADGSSPEQQAQGGRVPDASVAPTAQSQTFLTSFDCRRATNDDEIAICDDAGLAAMDLQLSQLYASAMKTISDPQALERSESDWVLTRQMCDKDVDCLRHAYGERIGQFLGSVGSKPLLATNLQTDKQ